MPQTYTQKEYPMRVSTPLGPDQLLLVGLSGLEGMSRLFNFRLDLLAELKTPVPFDKLLGQTVVAEVGCPPNEEVRYISGICSRVGQGEQDETFTSYSMEIVPQFWLLGRIAQSRIFQQLAVPDILREVLKGLDVDFCLQGKYEPRDYCVQYRETDFNFASRLMEEEGIYYFFKHTAKGHTLVVADAPIYPEIPKPIFYDNTVGGTRPDERIHDWSKVQELRSGKYTLWDHCFELPHKHLEVDKTIQESVAAGTVSHKLKLAASDKLEVYDYPGEYAQRFDGVSPGGGDRPADLQKIFSDNARTVALRMQEEAVQSLDIRGSSNRRALTAGYKFTLQRHFDADGAYLLTSVQHSARVTGHRSDQVEFQYENTFTCIPLGLPFRPARVTPRPLVQGTQTAVVVGPAGDEIFTDKYGRVKVQFHWDRQGKNDGNSSCWIRVATSWAGKNWGVIHIPRIGQEVIVDFLEGDPDRPIIVGSVYNADMMPPYKLPDNKTQSGLQTRSTLGGSPANHNQIRFEDKKDAEQIHIHAEKNQDIEVENDETHWVGHDRKKTIDRDETTHVKRNRTETVDKDETIAIHANRTEAVDKEEKITIGGGRTESVGKEEKVTIGDNRTLIVAKNETISVGKTLAITAGDEISLTTGAASIVLKKDGTIEIKGKDITVIGSGKITAKASGDMTLKGQKILQN